MVTQFHDLKKNIEVLKKEKKANNLFSPHNK